MIIYFLNFQDKRDPDNERAISTEEELCDLLDRKRKAPPFIAELSGAGDFELSIGIGGDFGCAQYTRVNGDPPYLEAVSYKPPM